LPEGGHKLLGLGVAKRHPRPNRGFGGLADRRLRTRIQSSVGMSGCSLLSAS
jgi:hypothetical protein